MSRHGKYITVAAKPGQFADKRVTAHLVFVEQSRFGVDEVRRLCAERGVGPVSRFSVEMRDGFVPTKRRA